MLKQYYINTGSEPMKLKIKHFTALNSLNASLLSRLLLLVFFSFQEGFLKQAKLTH